MTSTERIGSEIEVRLPNGNWCRVHQGLPDTGLAYSPDYTLYFPPSKPHVFKVNRLIMENPEDLDHPAQDVSDKTILYMHGKMQDGEWVPEDDELVADGVTIPELVSAYQEATGQPIDFSFVCAEEKVTGRVINDHGQLSAIVEKRQ